MHVYISHSRVNSSAALQLCNELRKKNVQTWLDDCDMAMGADWDTVVGAAIQSATGFVFLLGPAGSADRWQTFEWQHVIDHEYYLDLSKPMIPVLLGEPEIPGFLRTRRTLVLTGDPESFATTVDEILKSIADPSLCLDQKKVALGQEARQRAIASFREYSEVLGREDLKRAELRAKE
jgi:hypothetical protein